MSLAPSKEGVMTRAQSQSHKPKDVDSDTLRLFNIGNDPEDMEAPPVFKEGETDMAVLISYMASLNRKMDNIGKCMYEPSDGIVPRVNYLTDQCDDATDRIRALEHENATMKADMKVMFGLIQRQSEQITHMKSDIKDQAARSMSTNLIIHNYEYEVVEGTRNLRPIAIKFFNDMLELTVEPREIYVAHKHSGENNIIVKVAYPLKEDIFAKISMLKGKKNSKDEKIFITEQQPESVRAARRDIKDIKDEYEEKNKKIPQGQAKYKTEVKRGQLYINNEIYKNPVPPPQPIEILGIEEDELTRMENMQLIGVKPQGEKGSSFKGIGVKVTSVGEARRAYKRVKREYPHASHVMMAYTFKKTGDSSEYGKQDDGEWGGSFKILEVLKDKKVSNVAVFVVREYGGSHIGPKRFTHISESAVKVLKKMQLA